MGYILGHEFGHSLTMLATLFDKSRALEDAWPAATKAKFDNRARCVSQSLDDEVKTDSDREFLQTKLWLEEAVADSSESIFRAQNVFVFCHVFLAGLRAAFDALQDTQREAQTKRTPTTTKLIGYEKYSDEQLFFMNFATVRGANFCFRARQQPRFSSSFSAIRATIER